MNKKNRPYGYWSKHPERCIAAAKKFTSISGFSQNHVQAYVIIKRLSLEDKAFSHMSNGKKPNGYWSKHPERCIAAAKKFTSISEFVKVHYAAYNTIRKLGLEEQAFGHMVRVSKPNGYWSKYPQRCIAAAKKFTSISEFMRAHIQAYTIIKKLGLEDKAFKHMRPVTNDKLRGLYVHLFIHKKNKKGFFYIGLTDDYRRRLYEHNNNKSGVLNKFLKARHLYHYLEFKTGLIYSPEEARNIEQEWIHGKSDIDFLRMCFEKHTLVNRKPKSTSLGGNTRYWTRTRVIEHLKKWVGKSRTEFIRKNSGCYKAAVSYGLWNDFSSKMTAVRKPNGYWATHLPLAYEAAKNYQSRLAFYKGDLASYLALSKAGKLNDACKHMSAIVQKTSRRSRAR